MADETVRRGQILFVKGEQPRDIIMLQSGTLEILSTSDEFNGLDHDIIISKGKRVGLIRAKSLISGFSRLFVDPYSHSVRALEDSVITKYPLRGGIKEIASSDTNQAISILRQLYTRMSQIISDADKYSKIYINVSRLSDNFALIYKVISGTGASGTLHMKADNLYNSYTSMGGTVPQQFDANFLIADNSRLYKKTYKFSNEPLEATLNVSTSDLIKKLLQLDPNVLKSVIVSDPAIAVSMFQTLTDDMMKGLGRIAILIDYIDNEMNALFSAGESWTKFLVDQGGFDYWRNTRKISESFIKNFLSVVLKINAVYEEISGRRFMDIYPGIAKINNYIATKGSAPAAQPVQQAAQGDFAPVGHTQPLASGAPAVHLGDTYKRSMSQIFEFALVDKEFQSKFVKLMAEFKTMQDPFNTESDGRKFRKNVTKLYWDLYKQVFIRSKSESAMPRPARLMLNFGFLDETIVDEQQIADLNDFLRIKEKSGEIPVMLEYDFLSMIYSGEEEPSINEMGLTYDAYIREMSKTSKISEAEANDPVNKALYEIDQRLASTAAVCSGSTITSFPILNNLFVKGNFREMYVTKQKMVKSVRDLMEIDFSAFYRETVLKLGEAREVISEEVIPYFVLIPIAGTKALMWQELSGNNRRSRGRITVPIIFMGDLVKNLAHSFASFRWELNRTMKGGMWGDPIEGGVTGEYFDYINTYKKNSKLSQDAKDRVTEKFKSLRTNRDRFADDYLQWVFFERDGIMKLNNVAREIFFKNVPFKKDVRDRLGAMPSFAQLAQRYINVSKRNFLALERKMKKYQTADGEYPEVIKKYLEYLQM